MGEDASPAALKAQLRVACRAAREAVGEGPRAAAATRLFARLAGLRGHVIAGYLPIGSEVDPTGAMRVLRHDNRVCVPVVTARGAPLRFREWWPGCATAPGAFGIEEPVEGGWRVPDVVIVPLLGFDAGGGRLGYGGGFYDRTLSGLHARRVLGLAVDAQRVEAVPSEETDVELPEIVTESRIWGPGPDPED